MRSSTTLPFKDLRSTIPEYSALTKTGNWDISQRPKVGIILHTMDGYLAGTDAWFTRPTTKSSTHYGIGLNGEIHQYVDEKYTSYANGLYAINQTFITIEFEDNKQPGSVKRTPEQLQSGANLIKDICQSWNILINRNNIRGHREVNPGSAKTCPGNLPMDQLVQMASTEYPTPSPTQPEPTMIYLSEQVKARGFGNIEGMCRALFDAADKYTALLQPDASNKPPVVIPSSEYIDLAIKGANLEKIATYLGGKDVILTDPSLGDKLIEVVKALVLTSIDNTPVTFTTTQGDISALQRFLNLFKKK